MNTERTDEPALAELSARRVDEIEDALFADIARERTVRRARRRRVWLAGGSAAAVVVLAVVVAPTVGGIVTASGGASSSVDESAVAPAVGSGGDSPVRLENGSAPVPQQDGAFSGGAMTDQSTAGRDIITTASATVVVDDTSAAARAVGDAAVARGGYVESMSVGSSGAAPQVDPATGLVYTPGSPSPVAPDTAWVTVRVPSAQLTAAIADLAAVGEVSSSSVNRQDVTEQTVDLKARIAATQASVDRLTQLMAQAVNVGDLIAAETALSERQATLESYQQQLASLQGMVDMSSLSVTLTPEVVAVEADPAGFGEGLAAGWNGLVATLNGVVVALGFLLPWVAVVAVAALIVWGVVRLVRRSRRGRARRAPQEADDAAAHDEDA